MKLRIFALASLLLFLTYACKKDKSELYQGDFYIKIPIIENDSTYLDPGSAFDDLYIIYNGFPSRKLWRLTRINGKEFNIAPADSVSILVTELNGFGFLEPRDTSIADHQTFIIVPSPGNQNLVSFQSLSSGKFIDLQYCYKDHETWGYATPVDDSSNCQAYQQINLSAQADTCYCVHQFLLVSK